VNLGMRPSGTLMPTFSDNFSMPDNNAADTRIGGSSVEATCCQLQRKRHMLVISGRE
jgi:hypothetical protein